jgi:hypothetical protein
MELIACYGDVQLDINVRQSIIRLLEDMKMKDQKQVSKQEEKTSKSETVSESESSVEIVYKKEK